MVRPQASERQEELVNFKIPRVKDIYNFVIKRHGSVLRQVYAQDKLGILNYILNKNP